MEFYRCFLSVMFVLLTVDHLLGTMMTDFSAFYGAFKVPTLLGKMY